MVGIQAGSSSIAEGPPRVHRAGHMDLEIADAVAEDARASDSDSYSYVLDEPPVTDAVAEDARADDLLSQSEELSFAGRSLAAESGEPPPWNQ